jgi:hypothetical protein
MCIDRRLFGIAEAGAADTPSITGKTATTCCGAERLRSVPRNVADVR